MVPSRQTTTMSAPSDLLSSPRQHDFVVCETRVTLQMTTQEMLDSPPLMPKAAAPKAKPPAKPRETLGALPFCQYGLATTDCS